jgi:hypothetical protein
LIVGLLRDLDFVISVFPLHDKEDIKLIERDWFMSKDSLFKSQDIRKNTKQSKIYFNNPFFFLRKSSKLFR